jgi:hypothetical protein
MAQVMDFPPSKSLSPSDEYKKQVHFRAQISIFRGPPLPMALGGGNPITKPGAGPENRENLEINRDMFSAQDTLIILLIIQKSRV